MLILFTLLLLGLFTYSYALIDPNLTLINASWWVSLRDPLVYFGYYQRPLSITAFIIIIALLFVFHWYFIRNYSRFSLWKIVGIIFVVLVLSYPFLSHDLFNYIFDAKILTFYGDNPYTHIPGNYPDDKWLRFMHWTERSYPYGPVFLPLTLIPSFLGAGKFILNFFFFKLLSFIFYFIGVYLLSKISRKTAFIFATHPLVIIEGLINNHNDLIGVVLGFVGIYYLSKSKKILARFLMMASIGIKYLTFPILFISKKSSIRNIVLFAVQIGIIIYLSGFTDLRPWYFLTIFVFLPLYSNVFEDFSIFFFGLLISYYPFIRYGNWEMMSIKNTIVISAFLLNVVFLLSKRYYYLKK